MIYIYSILLYMVLRNLKSLEPATVRVVGCAVMSRQHASTVNEHNLLVL